MLNFGASKPMVKGPGPQAPPLPRSTPGYGISLVTFALFLVESCDATQFLYNLFKWNYHPRYIGKYVK